MSSASRTPSDRGPEYSAIQEGKKNRAVILTDKQVQDLHLRQYKNCYNKGLANAIARHTCAISYNNQPELTSLLPFLEEIREQVELLKAFIHLKISDSL